MVEECSESELLNLWQPGSRGGQRVGGSERGEARERVTGSGQGQRDTEREDGIRDNNVVPMMLSNCKSID